MNSTNTIIPNNPLKYVVWTARSLRKYQIVAISAVTVAVILTRVFFFTIKKVTDSAVEFNAGRIPVEDFWFWCAAVPVLYLINGICWRTSGFSGMRWITGAVANSNRALFGFLLGHSSAYFKDRYAGALVNKISNASSGVDEITRQSLWQFYTLFLAFIIDIYLTFLAHPYFSISFTLWFVTFVSINIYLMGKLSPFALRRAEASSQLKGAMVDSISNIDTVNNYGQQRYESSHLESSIDNARQTHLAEWVCSEYILVVNNFLIALQYALMLGLGGWLFSQGRITVGALVMIVTISINVERNLWFICQSINQAVSCVGLIKEGLRDLLLPHGIVDQQQPITPSKVNGHISFDKINFQYGDVQDAVFTSFKLEIPAGQKVGLVGRSGAGKTTLVSLLMRSFEVTEGQIKIDGQDIRELELESLKRMITLVPQDTMLFHRSILDNINYGRLDATKQEIEHAAHLAQADEFIDKLPQSYDTLVGERGIKLSGGQRQRIAIARAFLKNSPILVLDEATSALDSESEGAIQRALTELMKGKTVIAIAHRLSTLQIMDRICVIEEGIIKEDGSHEELLNKNGLYAQLWSNQVKGFIQE